MRTIVMIGNRIARSDMLYSSRSYNSLMITGERTDVMITYPNDITSENKMRFRFIVIIRLTGYLVVHIRSCGFAPATVTPLGAVKDSAIPLCQTHRGIPRKTLAVCPELGRGSSLAPFRCKGQRNASVFLRAVEASFRRTEGPGTMVPQVDR